MIVSHHMSDSSIWYFLYLSNLVHAFKTYKNDFTNIYNWKNDVLPMKIDQEAEHLAYIMSTLWALFLNNLNSLNLV